MENSGNQNKVSGLHSSCFGKQLYYTNGQYLIAIIPPPYAAIYGFDISQQICRKFSLVDGTFICNSLIDVNYKC